jgi:hypothetical protein
VGYYKYHPPLFQNIALVSLYFPMEATKTRPELVVVQEAPPPLGIENMAFLGIELQPLSTTLTLPS